MKYYNIYYKGSKINNRPITEEDLELIKNESTIQKRNIITGKLETISTNQLKFISTIII